eukprot:4769814-Pleurochrysis_carterae.AAC.2
MKLTSYGCITALAARTATVSFLPVSCAMEADLRSSSATSNALRSGTSLPPACSFEKAMAFCRVTSSSSNPADARRIKSSMRALSSYGSSGVFTGGVLLVDAFGLAFSASLEPAPRIRHCAVVPSAIASTSVNAEASLRWRSSSKSFRTRLRIIESSICSTATGVPKSWHMAPRYLPIQVLPIVGGMT